MNFFFRSVSSAVVLCMLQGCLVKAIVGVAAETVEAGIELTGAAAGAVVDVAIPDKDDDDDKDKKDD